MAVSLSVKSRLKAGCSQDWLPHNQGLIVLRSIILLLVVASTLAAQGGYGGPSVLSRAGNRPGHRGRTPIDFTFYAGARGIYETGLIPVAIDREGNISPSIARGAQVEAGAYGAHNWRRSSFGVDYRGDYRYNTRFSQFNGFNQAISLDYAHTINRRLQATVRQIGGVFNRAFGSFAAPAFADIDRLGVPGDEVFDTRVYFLQTSGVLAYRKSARTTYAITADAFFVKRPSLALVGSQGYRLGAVAEYRMSRRTAVSGIYQYMVFEYPRAYGGATTHMVAGKYDHRFNQNWDVSITGGIMQISLFGTRQVTLSPEVAAILGRLTGVEAFRDTVYRPNVQADANYTLERSRLNMQYSEGISAGNGVFLTMYRRSVRAGYSYTGIRKLSLAASAGYSTGENLGTDLGSIDTANAGGAISYAIVPHVNLSINVDRRRFSTGIVQGRNGWAASVGLMFTPATFPVSIW